MNTQTLSKLILSVFMLSNTASFAATSGADYTFVDYKFIDSASSATPTIIAKVLVTCPANGILISTASTEFGMSTDNQVPGSVSVQYGISKNSQNGVVSTDLNNFHILEHDTNDGITNGTGSYQRIDRCTSGQKATLYFVASKVSGGSIDARKASLVVTFAADPRI